MGRGDSKVTMLNIAKFFLGLVIWVFTQQIALTQGAVTFLSNLSGPSVTNLSDARSGFITGNNSGGYVLNAIQLAMNNPVGNPNDFTVTIYQIINSLGDSGPPVENYIAALNGSDPLKAGVYNYRPTSQLILVPNSDYLLVVTNGGDGSFEWSVTAGSHYFTSLGGWSYGDTLSGPQFAITATPVPEPKFYYLFVFGCLKIFFCRRTTRLVKSSI